MGKCDIVQNKAANYAKHNSTKKQLAHAPRSLNACAAVQHDTAMPGFGLSGLPDSWEDTVHPSHDSKTGKPVVLDSSHTTGKVLNPAAVSKNVLCAVLKRNLVKKSLLKYYVC